MTDVKIHETRSCAVTQNTKYGLFFLKVHLIDAMHVAVM